MYYQWVQCLDYFQDFYWIYKIVGATYKERIRSNYILVNVYWS